MKNTKGINLGYLEKSYDCKKRHGKIPTFSSSKYLGNNKIHSLPLKLKHYTNLKEKEEVKVTH